MFNKLKTFLKWSKYFGFSDAVELSLFHLGFKKSAIFKKRIFNYPITSLKIEIDEGPIDFWKSLEQGKWDIELIRFIKNLVNPGDTILDIGAWIGPTTFLFSHLIGKNGRVYAFEPNPESFSILKNYVIDNNLDNYNIYLQNMALSNSVGFVKLYAPSQIDQKSTIQRELAGAFKFKYEWKCDCTTIDEFCHSRDIRPNGIKIDVEGAEMNVLEGAIEIIEKYHPWFILEFHGLFLSEFERRRIWSFITDRAKKIIYLFGDEDYLTYKMDEPLNFKPAERSNYCIFF